MASMKNPRRVRYGDIIFSFTIYNKVLVITSRKVRFLCAKLAV